MIAATSHRYLFRVKKKGIQTPPPRARVRKLTFVQAATDLTVPAGIFNAVLARIGYHYRRYTHQQCIESIRLRLFTLAYRISSRTPGSIARETRTYTCFRYKLGLKESASAAHTRPASDHDVRIIDGFIRETLLARPEFGFTREIIDDALARSVPHRIAPSRAKGPYKLSPEAA